MLKKTMVALAGLFMVLGLAAAPASAASAADITAWPNVGFSGAPEVLQDRNECASIDLTGGAHSARNDTTDARVTLFALPMCLGPVSVLQPGDEDSGLVADTGQPNALGQLGAVSYIAVQA